MTVAIVVALIAGALLGLYLWSKRAGASAGAGAGEGWGAGGLIAPGESVGKLFDAGPDGAEARAQRRAEIATFGAGGWKLVAGGVEAVGKASAGVLFPIDFFPGATGYTGMAPDGQPTYPDGYGRVETHSPILGDATPYQGGEGSVGTATLTGSPAPARGVVRPSLTAAQIGALIGAPPGGGIVVKL